MDANIVASIKPLAFERLSQAASYYESRSFLPIAQVGTIVEVYNLGANYYYLI
jgi:hypothetical protein